MTYADFECEIWGVNYDLQRKGFDGLMNALCCCRQTLPWPKGLSNYLHDNWFCTVNTALRFD
jgi:hypothetical protein